MEERDGGQHRYIVLRTELQRGQGVQPGDGYSAVITLFVNKREIVRHEVVKHEQDCLRQ